MARNVEATEPRSLEELRARSRRSEPSFTGFVITLTRLHWSARRPISSGRRRRQGFWDDQRRAARTRPSWRGAAQAGDVRAPERRGGRAGQDARDGGRGRRVAGELERTLASSSGDVGQAAGGRAVHRRVRHRAGGGRRPRRRRRHRQPGLGRDAAAHVPALGRVARLQDRDARGDAGGGGRAEERHVHADRRQRLRDHAGREGRPPAGAALAVRLGPPPAHRASPRSRWRRWSTTTSTSRSTRTTCGSTRTAPRARAASTSTRPTRPCGSPTSPPGSSCSARTSARSCRTRPRRCGS